MKLFNKTTQLTCPPHQWTTLIRNLASGMPATWNITFQTPDGGPVRGRYWERRALWIFPQPAVEGPLFPQMTFHRQWINAYYELRIYPEHPIIVTIQ